VSVNCAICTGGTGAGESLRRQSLSIAALDCLWLDPDTERINHGPWDEQEVEAKEAKDARF
jgi:hypothetical protein